MFYDNYYVIVFYIARPKATVPVGCIPSATLASSSPPGACSLWLWRYQPSWPPLVCFCALRDSVLTHPILGAPCSPIPGTPCSPHAMYSVLTPSPVLRH